MNLNFSSNQFPKHRDKTQTKEIVGLTKFAHPLGWPSLPRLCWSCGLCFTISPVQHCPRPKAGASAKIKLVKHFKGWKDLITHSTYNQSLDWIGLDWPADTSVSTTNLHTTAIKALVWNKCTLLYNLAKYAYLGAPNMVKWGFPEKILQNVVQSRWS